MAKRKLHNGSLIEPAPLKKSLALATLVLEAEAKAEMPARGGHTMTSRELMGAVFTLRNLATLIGGPGPRVDNPLHPPTFGKRRAPYGSGK